MQPFIDRITRPLPDSLNVESAGDSLSILNFDWAGIRFGSDLSQSAGADLMGQAGVDAATMFGPESVLSQPTQAVAQQVVWGSTGDSVVYKIVVLLLFMAICYVVYAFKGSAAELLKTTTRKISSDNYISQNKSFKIFLQYLLALGTLSFGVLAIRWGNVPGQWSVLMAASAPVAVGLYQVVALRIAGNVTLSKGFVGELLNIKTVVAALGVIFISPVVLLIATYSGALFYPISYLIVAEIVAILLLGIAKTYSLFVGQRVPILNWFLYLCAVEIFPCSLLVIIIAKTI